MSSYTNQGSTEHPLEIARAAFRLLVTRRIVPTPEAYRLAYDEVSGVSQRINAESILADFAASCQSASPALAAIGAHLTSAVGRRDWAACAEQFTALQALLAAQASPAATAMTSASRHVPTSAERQADLLRSLLSRTLSLALASLLQHAPKLAQEANDLGRIIKDSTSHATLEAVTARLRQLCFEIELFSGDSAEQQELLLRMFRLLLENISELIDDDDWMRTQITVVRTLLSGPITHRVLDDATRNLKEIIYKQGVLKQGVAEARAAVKKTMLMFIDQLGTIVASSSDFSEKIDRYTDQISNASDIGALNAVLGKLMQATRATQDDASKARDDMLRARRELHEAEARVQRIEAEFSQLSELVHEDTLTGVLNRRGIHDMLVREVARAERRSLPFCLAMLVIDDLPPALLAQDPAVADQARLQLTRIAGDTLRTMDIVARIDGNEFMIVLPDTSLENAEMVLTRLQRDLTEQVFMHDEQRLFMTFCAGIALRAAREESDETIARAAAALQRARQAGRNRVVIANQSAS